MLFLLAPLASSADVIAPLASSADVNSLPLTLFEPSTGARCLDGSLGGYHSRVSSKTQLMISLPGGGWCWDDSNCAARATTSLGSMDAFIKSNGMTREVGEGELNGLPALNPHFYNFSMLSPVYCDGSNFAGGKDHANVSVPGGNGTTIKLYVRGRAILQAALDVALEQWGLKDTLEEVMLTGCSAGGTATYFNVDFVHSYMASKLTHRRPLKTRAFGNAGWFLDTNSATWDGDGWTSVPGIQRLADKALYSYAGLAPMLSAQCQASYAPLEESWKCAMSQYLYPFLEQPTLVLQSSYDLNQLVSRSPGTAWRLIGAGIARSSL